MSIACRRTAVLPAFSLIELLTVMVILLALGAMAASAGFGSTLNTGQSSRQMLRAQLHETRAHAIASRRSTAFIIEASAGGGRAGRKMASIEVETGNESYQPVKNEMGETIRTSKWIELPQNYHFVSSEMIMSDAPTALDHEKTLAISDRGREIECHMIVFGPNGQIIYPNPGITPVIAIAQLNGRGDASRIIRDAAGDPVFDLMQINRFTGNAKRISP